ncbi:CelB protein (plasmid) [Neorhizobium galegae bv. officinalis bv. officinalis str. HAMBI 1141]|jgi:hypothetical protein|uniref:Cyclic di-GMP-binding protein n=1 Tax=Neorhizobium galegae bv. officinalis bv. officinalis str. HAMBI 1141 TaxID=1028801 RepID=A0A068THW4_NEOGA|nr:cellulose biosynthesis cyclic di-GMP-binding regulatory protein BcsB [Neorhizobium galegae]CDN57913.1 CelB protein [Neorhizobium galegae bv. officinalis bv. officinalis str. HAMBI 1141]
MTRRPFFLFSIFVIWLAATGPVLAQAAPFDMGPERPSVPVAPAPQLPELLPRGPAAQPAPNNDRRSDTTPSAQPPERQNRRYILPVPELALTGELDRRSWSIYLTEQQVSGPISLAFSFRNAIVVAPEASRLTVLLNGRQVADEAISAADRPRTVSLEVPAGILQAGSNQIEFRANQRHRTDCDIRSTYELWTRIDPAETFLTLGGQTGTAPSIAEAIRAIGADAKGATSFEVLLPTLGQPGATVPLLRLAQGLSLLAGMPSQSFSFHSQRLPAPRPGHLGIVIGTAAELQPVFPGLPAAAQNGSLLTWAVDPQTDQPVLLITGPRWTDIRAAIDTFVTPLDRSLATRRDVITTQRWSTPDAPLLFGGETLALSQLGMETIEFPGRRVRTNFNLAVPSDFYANAFGEGQLLLDAAFTDAVLPGSHIDVYVNGNIASTVPITSSKGGILRHLPIKVALRHIRPGLNTIGLEAIITTEADTLCAPGSTAAAEPRLAIFNTSEWQMPAFGRIGRTPNLAALAATGYPYARDEEPLQLFVDRFDADTMSAVSTFMGKLALAAGHVIATELVATPTAVGDRNAIFFGSLSQMPARLLAQTAIAADGATSWRPASPLAAPAAATSAAFEQWRTRVSGGIWSGQVSAFQAWLQRNFDISAASLRILPSTAPPFRPSPTHSLLIAQGASPAGEASWTLVTSPTSAELKTSVEMITRLDRWGDVGGRLSAYASKTDTVTVLAESQIDYRSTGGVSLNNYRLVLTNWLSTNVLAYTILLVVFAVIFGLATASVLSRLGRRK